jgi:creatinase
VVLTSMHNVAYYSGFLYCSFGRPYACVVTKTECVTISAGIDAGQPWRRSIGDNITYTDWARDNMWRAVASVTGTGKAVGCEADHLTMERAEKFNTFLKPKRGMDIAPATMHQRMTKSPAEIALIKHGANVADVGGYAIRDAIKEGATELEISPSQAATRWNARLPSASRMPNTATPGSGSSPASTPMARITR